ncbi:cation-translocating P-type ATPase [Dissulfurirhabdus thermomarina]|uniref:Cation-translocating P-type ATPase n=1 Tax=Dissulfurirhabdus thermomarina TaxID=1765737 RepID=A0A6N9TS22_DISTH|nr:cation-translocating P-type ATPase [Dissulfurirhabdus thermomarina]NDY41366.1 cation-translocating P-type ATPase [Dissulfurirhabdus thermomarina]NMX23618.1 cation-translocating P-type ATPase [Dissulfurirhabdus thermomarina]
MTAVPETDPARPAHGMPPEEVLRRLGAAEGGLAEAEAARRLARHGPNRLRASRGRSLVRMALDQFRDAMILLLLVAAVVSGLIGEARDTVVILVIVCLNAVVGFVQEYRAERAMEALRAMAAPEATVVRGGVLRRIPAADLVPGDLVALEAGQVVPADLRLVEAAALQVDESPLTGESQPVEKAAEVVLPAGTPLGDRVNMAFKGTRVTHGRGRGVAVATGMATQVGHIARLLEGAEELRTPLQKRLVRVGRNLAAAALVICAVVFAAGLWRGEEPVLMFLTAVSLAVAAVPEALPAVVTISLALGARQMVRRHVLIRRLPAVETLGSVTTICTDKTGTLTQNRMHVERLVGPDLREIPADRPLCGPDTPEAARWLGLALAVSNDVGVDEAGGLAGDPTETALVERAAVHGCRKADLEALHPRVGEIPFDSQRQAMTTVHAVPGGGFLSLTKGGFEAVAAMCPGLDRAAADGVHRALAAEGLRVLAFACRRWAERPADLSPGVVEQGLEFLGMAAALDPPRPEAADAVARCHEAGIRPVMITGDHPLTALSIARRIGLVRGGATHAVVTGAELAARSEAEFEALAGEVQVYARVAPEEKLRLVAALQRRGEAVAMTGDGVNDAPALKQAEIGVAMGKVGTDVAKEAADMILLDDNFASIVGAVEEGRRIYDNIRKFFKYTLTSNAGEIWTVFLAPFLGLPVPLLPVHILWVNLITDGLPGLALGLERAEPDVMRRPPRPPGESLFAGGLWQHLLVVGLLMGGVCLTTQALAIRQGWHWQTMVFTVLCLSQFGHALAIRSDRASFFSWGPFSNRFLAATVAGSTALQLLVVYLPFFQGLFRTRALTPVELGVTLALSTVVFLAVEAEKAALRRGWIRYR